MTRVLARRPAALLALAAALVAVAVVAMAAAHGGPFAARAQACPNGFLTRAEQRTLLRHEQRFERDHAKGGSEGESARRDAPLAACAPRNRPESIADVLAAHDAMSARDAAPATRVDPRAYGRALRAKAALAAGNALVAGSAGQWSPVGHGPLLSGQPGYSEVRFGLHKLNGRVSDFAYDDQGGRLFAAVANGGVWESDDLGGSWRDIGAGLPTQIVGSVKWVPAHGGRPGALIALTGDNAFGGYTYPGAGAFRSTDGGQTWTRAAGIPDGALGFKIAVDPTNADVVWAATGLGLYRSADGGASFAQVTLPTGACAGQSLTKKGCFLANVVTDVVVEAPDSFGHGGGRVLAAVGWRQGTKRNPDGTVQAPANGIYTNTTASPTAFTKMPVESFVTPANPQATAQDSVGRVELAIANGPGQNHDYVYAVVQDAYLFNHNGVQGIDAPEVRDPVFGGSVLGKRTVLNGVYASSNFGASWTQMTNGDELQTPGSNSALVGVYNGAAEYGPGIQSWYDQFIDVDPTRQVAGVPTRLTFGLEEVWQNASAQTSPGTPQNGKSSFQVIGRYFSGETCQGVLTLPSSICPTSNPPIQGTTTHPDQHAAITVPITSGPKKGGVALVVGDDGGAFVQQVGPGEAMTNDKWGDGANDGFYTLLPYDAHMAKDGTVYAGLQDNGQLKIQPDGKQIAVQGGDGFYSAVDPDNSDVEYGEVSGGLMYRSTDGGKTSSFIDPELTHGQFVTPFAMDPADAKHLLIAGRDVKETVFGPDTQSPSTGLATSWKKVYDLGTRAHRGDPAAAASAGDPANSASAMAMRGTPPLPKASGPKSADVPDYQGGQGTAPGGGTGLPTEYDDHEFTIKPNEVDATATISIRWASANDDWDLYVLRKNPDGSEDQVGTSANGGTTSETVTLTDPQPGTYVVRADNFAAPGDTYTGSVKFTAVPAGATAGSGRAFSYIGFCGYCDPLTEGTPFDNGIATNVTGAMANANMTGEGWHVAQARGLPKRTVTGLAIDAADPKTVYVTLGGYQVRPFVPPGALGDDTSRLGSGHLFVSNDAGESFRDISGDLPDIPATAVTIRGGQPVVATNIGVFIGTDLKGGHFVPLGTGLPPAPVFNLSTKPGDPELLLAASFGRGVQAYRYKDPAALSGARAAAQACAANSLLRKVAVRPRGRGLRVGFKAPRGVRVHVDVFQVSIGRRILRERLVARFVRRSSFTWNGRANARHRVAHSGYMFARLTARVAHGGDVRRFVLARAGGRFHARPAHYRRASCALVKSYKLSRPVFGGASARPLGIAWQVSRRAKVQVSVLYRGHVVRRFRTVTSRANRTYRLRFPARRARRGDYTVRLRAAAGHSHVTTRLVSRRL